MTIRAKNIEPQVIHSSHFDPTLRNGFIPIDISIGRITGSTSGESWANATAAVGTPGAGLLSSATAPQFTAISTAVRVPVLDWASASLVQVSYSVTLPPDYSSLSSGTLNILAGREAAGSSDTAPSWQVRWHGSTGSSHISCVSVTAASSVATHYTMGVNSSANIGYPGILTFLINPLSTADSNKLYGLWLTYTRNSTNTT